MQKRYDDQEHKKAQKAAAEGKDTCWGRVGFSASYLFPSQLIYHVCRRFQEERRALDHEADFKVSGTRNLYHRQARSSCAVSAESDAWTGVDPTKLEACGSSSQAEERIGEKGSEVKRRRVIGVREERWSCACWILPHPTVHKPSFAFRQQKVRPANILPLHQLQPTNGVALSQRIRSIHALAL